LPTTQKARDHELFVSFIPLFNSRSLDRSFNKINSSIMKSLYNKATLTDRLFAGLAAFALVVAMVPVSQTSAAAPGVYQITSSDYSLTGTVLELSGTSSANPQVGANNTQRMAVDWDLDQDLSTSNWQNNETGEIIFLPTFFGGNQNNATGFSATWSASFDYAGYPAGTYNVRVLVYRGNTPGQDGSDEAMVTFTVVIPPTPTTGTLTVNKVVVGGTTATSSFAFTLDGGVSTTSFDGSGTNQISVDLGAYAVTEYGVVEGKVTVGDETYSVEYSAGCSGTMTADGAECTVTNTFVNPDATTGTLTVNKVVVGGTTATSSFAFTLDGGVSTTSFDGSGTNQVSVDLGAYAVTEYGVVEGKVTVGDETYSVEYSAGCSGTMTAAGAECTITNTFVNPDATTGTLTVNKVVVGGTTATSSFAFTLDGGVSTTSFDGSGTNQISVDLGAYAVTEYGVVEGKVTVGDETYSVEYSAGCSGTMTADGAECTVTNTFVDPGNGGNGTPPIVVTTTGGGGSCINCGPTGTVAGEETSREETPEPTTELVTTTPRPEGMVGGEQVSIVPVGAPATGAGGTSGTPMQAIPMMALLALIASLAVLRRTAHEA
jgi:hypothetical protein